MKSIWGLTVSTLVSALALGCGEGVTDPDVSFHGEGAEIQAKKVAGGQQHGGRPLSADLTGAAEVPGPGDPDGSGTAEVTLNQGKGEVCFAITVADIAPAFAAHIHVGAADVAGPVVVGLTPPADGSSNGCVAGVDRDLIQAIGKNPSGYYVNVHNAAFPPGAVRGQLAK